MMEDDGPFSNPPAFTPQTGPDFSQPVSPIADAPPPRPRKGRAKKAASGPVERVPAFKPRTPPGLLDPPKRGRPKQSSALDLATVLKIAGGLEQEDLEALAGAVELLQDLPPARRRAVAAALARVFQ